MPYYSFLRNKDLIVRAHKLGLSVNVWTVDDKAMWEKLIRAGVDRITTNEPMMIIDFINR
ncbi:MAG: hypothetical protein LKI53_02290 [Bacteroidales bacterium]|jgi:glycerophosphoryl diester phosphodiesterase|nr:hypothetical protein [Bacteroidales bacterium]